MTELKIFKIESSDLAKTSAGVISGEEAIELGKKYVVVTGTTRDGMPATFINYHERDTSEKRE